MDLPSGSEDEYSDEESSSEEEDDPAVMDESVWRLPEESSHYDPDEYKFLGVPTMPQEVLACRDPLDYFKLFMTEDILEFIVEESNHFAKGKRPNSTPLNLTVTELKKFIGSVLWMSCVKLPQSRLYWSSDVGQETIKRAFTCNRWEEIKTCLHFNRNEDMHPRGHPEFDKQFKIRPVLEMIRQKFRAIPKEEHISMDEQIMPTKARTSLKQYNPAKPHKWGYKLWALCGQSGFNYDFELYGGKESYPQRLPGEPDLGACANTVVRLARTIPRNLNHKLYFDNYFSTLQLLSYLQKEGIPSIGTVRIVRVKNHNMIPPKEFAKTARGTVQERVAKIDGTKLSLVQWNDNRIVTTISSFVGKDPTTTVSRFQRKTKSHINIQRPHSITKYNENMGGVDKMDSLLGYYRIQLRSKRWYTKVFFHLLDMIVVNCWSLKRMTEGGDEEVPLYYFKVLLAEQLLLTNQVVRRRLENGYSTPTRKRGRPSSNPGSPSSPAPSTPKKTKNNYFPAATTIYDNVGHLPEYKDANRTLCAMEDCQFRSQVICIKCQVALCFNSHRNCFLLFHTEADQ